MSGAAGPGPTRRVLVCGGRNFDHQPAMSAYLDALIDEIGSFELVCGGQKTWQQAQRRWIGADYQAAVWALQRDIVYHVEPADWARYGRAAGPLRNQRMLHIYRPVLVVAFPGGRGTANMIAAATSAHTPVRRPQP